MKETNTTNDIFLEGLKRRVKSALISSLDSISTEMIKYDKVVVKKQPKIVAFADSEKLLPEGWWKCKNCFTRCFPDTKACPKCGTKKGEEKKKPKDPKPQAAGVVRPKNTKKGRSYVGRKKRKTNNKRTG